MRRTESVLGGQSIHTVSVSPGKRSKGDVVLVHMSWGGAWVFEYYQKFFAEAGYASHAVELRGHGESGGKVESATMYDYVADVRTAVLGLEIENPVVVGHSMGGLVALMYGKEYGARGIVSMDGSPTLEVQKTSEHKVYPPTYTPTDAGMPTTPLRAMRALGDIYPWRLMKMKSHLGIESGAARSQRKKGISVPRESLKMPLLFVGAEKGTSLKFGIGIEKARAQAEYYGAPVVEIEGATHPGLLIGKHWKETAEAVLEWIETEKKY